MSSWINDSLQNWQKYIFTSNNLCPFWTFDWTIFLSVGNQPSLHQAFLTSGVKYNFHSEERDPPQSNCPIEMMAKTPGSCTVFGRFLGSTEPLEDFAENKEFSWEVDGANYVVQLEIGGLGAVLRTFEKELCFSDFDLIYSSDLRNLEIWGNSQMENREDLSQSIQNLGCRKVIINAIKSQIKGGWDQRLVT